MVFVPVVAVDAGLQQVASFPGLVGLIPVHRPLRESRQPHG
jgi:hypothetical protein